MVVVVVVVCIKVLCMKVLCMKVVCMKVVCLKVVVVVHDDLLSIISSARYPSRVKWETWFPSP